MRGEAQHIQRKRPPPKSGITGPKFTNLLPDVEVERVIGGVKMRIHVAILPSIGDSAQNDGGYATFRRLAPEIGYHSNVP